MLDTEPSAAVSPLTRSIFAAAHVVFEDEDRAVYSDDVPLACVYYEPGATPAAWLSASLRGHPDAGDVLHEVMEATAGLHGPDWHVWWPSERRTARPIAEVIRP